MKLAAMEARARQVLQHNGVSAEALSTLEVTPSIGLEAGFLVTITDGRVPYGVWVPSDGPLVTPILRGFARDTNGADEALFELDETALGGKS